jgi:hypothetical protein
MLSRRRSVLLNDTGRLGKSEFGVKTGFQETERSLRIAVLPFTKLRRLTVFTQLLGLYFFVGNKLGVG